MDWYPWYPALYRADTLDLTLEQDGAYRRLIDHYCHTERPIPNDDNAIADIIGVSLDKWLEVKEKVTRYFRVSNAHLTHQTCDEVIKEYKERTDRIANRRDFRLDLLSKEWAEIRTAIFLRDDFTCQYCGERGVRLECDHIFPVVLGGASTPENLATACFSCNRSKGSKTLEQWGRK